MTWPLARTVLQELIPQNDVVSCKSRLGVIFEGLVSEILSTRTVKHDIQAEAKEMFPDEMKLPDWLAVFVSGTIMDTAGNWARAVSIADGESERNELATFVRNVALQEAFTAIFWKNIKKIMLISPSVRLAALAESREQISEAMKSMIDGTVTLIEAKHIAI